MSSGWLQAGALGFRLPLGGRVRRRDLTAWRLAAKRSKSMIPIAIFSTDREAPAAPARTPLGAALQKLLGAGFDWLQRRPAP